MQLSKYMKYLSSPTGDTELRTRLVRECGGSNLDFDGLTTINRRLGAETRVTVSRAGDSPTQI